MTEKKQNRDFGSQKVYLPKKYNNHNSLENSASLTEGQSFRFKNSLIITPYYELEFHASGGIKYVSNHDDRIFFKNAGIFALTNNIQKIPVLLKRSINKYPAQKKLIVAEKYNYEEKYDIYINIILYYEENRLDFQIIFEKSDASRNTKDITSEFSLNLYIPGANGEITYKKYDGSEEYKEQDGLNNINGIEYITAEYGKRGGACMTLYPDKRHFVRRQDKSLCFASPNLSNSAETQKNHINLKIYLEKYKIT